jgi:hypothetical protein
MTAVLLARVWTPHVENGGGPFSDQAFGLVSWASSETLEPALAQLWTTDLRRSFRGSEKYRNSLQSVSLVAKLCYFGMER